MRMGEFMRVRRLLSGIVGVAQVVMGASAIMFAYALYHDFLSAREVLNIPAKNVPLYMMIPLLCGLQ